MRRTPFAISRQIILAVTWYGVEYSFYRNEVNSYNEPQDGANLVQTVEGIYHSSERAFIELINAEGTSVKSKVSRGILCSRNNNLTIQQDDSVEINGKPYHVTTVEPVLYGDIVVAYEISVEEVVEEGNDE